MNKYFKYIPFLLFAFSVFGNLQYPLLWNDEAECAMHSKRVLEYGFPKVHDGKNVVYPIRHPDKKLAIHEGTDAYTGIGWAMFYCGIISIKLAQYSDDLYIKTLLLRLPFAILGVLGLLIFFHTFKKVMKTKRERPMFFALFFLLLALQVDFALHLREMRYYALLIFFSGLVSWNSMNFRFLTDKKAKLYIILQSITLWIIYNVFPPIFLIICIFLFIVELYLLITYKKWKPFFTYLLPLVFASILLIPNLIFFEPFKLSSASNEFYGFYWKVYLVHLRDTCIYLFKFGIADWVTGFGVLIGLLLYYRKIMMDSTMRALAGLVLFAIIYFLVINFIPHFVFTRYLLLLNVVLLLIAVLQLVILYRLFTTTWFAILLLLITSGLIYKNYDLLEGRLYELTHRYKGPTDYEIEYIQENYENPSDLVIATNYEECSFMYYLDAKVTMGFVLNNLEEDLKVRPDVIIFRHDWAWNYERSVFDPLFYKGKYEEVEFPVYDFPYNNIPELNMNAENHLFRTRLAKEGEYKATVYVRR